MRVTKLTIAALAVVASLSLTACQNEDVAADPKPATSAPTANGDDTEQDQDQGEGQNQEGTVAGTGSNEDGKVADCRTDELEVTASDVTIEGDTVGTVAVEFTNGGGRDCTLTGYAGVDLKTGAGSLSAERTGEEAPGRPQGRQVGVVRRHLPGQRLRRLRRPRHGPGRDPAERDEVGHARLAGRLLPLPVTDGSGTPVKVGPIGSAGQGD